MKYLDLTGLGEVWANIKSYISSKIPTKTSQLQNDSNYATTSQLPSKTSQLTNDSDFTTNAKLATKQNTISDLATIRSGASKGATAVQPATLNSYAKTSAIPTKTSQLTNDSGFLTSTDISNKVDKATTLSGYGITDAYTKTQVDKKVSDLVNSAPETLDTLNELANALGNDPNFATTVATQIGTKANDNDVVHKNKDEVITSKKIIQTSAGHFDWSVPSWEMGTIPKTDQSNANMWVYDKNTYMFYTQVWNRADGSVRHRTGVRNKFKNGVLDPTGTFNENQFDIVVDKNANTYIQWSSGKVNNPIFPLTNNTFNLGTSTHKWKAVYANTFNGNLIGNANTATKATQDAAGNVITTTYAKDANVVHKSGDETIAGVKTFTASPFVSNYAVTNGYFTRLNQIARNEVPSQIYHSAFRVFDKNSKTLGEYCVEKSTLGSSLLHMDVHTEDSEGNDIMESLYLNLSNDGSKVRFYPAKDNRIDLGMSGNKWAKIYSDDVVHTSGNETISGVKSFSSGGCTFFKQIKINHNLGYGKDNPPSQAAYHNLIFTAANGWWGSYIENVTDTNGNSTLAFYVRNTNETLSRVCLECNINGSFSMYPFSNNTWDLGVSTRKWKTLNGINPGALGLPGNSSINIDTSDSSKWLLTGTTIAYTPTVNGWLTIVVKCSSSKNYISVSQHGFYNSCSYNSSGYMKVILPVYTGKDIEINAVGDAWVYVRLFPCLGNV